MTMAPTSLPAIIFLLIASSSFGNINAHNLPDVQLCKNQCQCDVIQQYIQADCSIGSLTEIPYEFPKPVTKLILSDNPIELILSSSFQDHNLEYLEEFQCVECQIERIESNAFQHLNRLKYIDISYNHINEISIQLFKNLKELRYVNLLHNEEIDCESLINDFVNELPLVEVHCGDSGEDEKIVVRLKRAATTIFPEQDNVTAVDGDAVVNDKSKNIDLSGTELPRSDLIDEDSDGWGVGTYIVLAILIVIISIICFKFVYLRLRKRCKKARRHSEEQPFDTY